MKFWFLLPVILFAACSGSSAEKRGEWSKGAKGERASVVSVEPAGLGEVAEYLVTNATVESESQADLFPQVSGRVVKVFKDDGDPVVRGEVLAIVENVGLDANAERATSELKKQESETEKLRVLHAKGAISDKELADAVYLLQSARTSSREARATFGETKIRAPFDGVVAAREVRVGGSASSGQRAFQVVDLSKLRVVAALPEREMSRVQVDQAVRLNSAYDESQEAVGRVERVAPVVDAASGTFRVTISLDASQSLLRPGQFVTVQIEVERRTQVLTVPRPSVVYEDGLPVVYRMIDKPPEEEDEKKEDDASKEKSSWFSFGKPPSAEKDKDDTEEDEKPQKVAERVSVELGLMDDKLAQILSGVEEGDVILVIGQSSLRDGALVQTPEMAQAEKEAEAAKKEAGEKENKTSESSEEED